MIIVVQDLVGGLGSDPRESTEMEVSDHTVLD